MFSGPIPARVNHRKLVVEKRKIEGSLPIDQLVRFGELVDSNDADVEVSLAFRKGRKRSGLMVGEAVVEVNLTCQNCMQPVSQRISAKFRHLLVSDEAQLLDLEDDEEGIVCPSEMVDVADLIEDELLLALPMVARHGSGQCAPADDQLADYQTEEPIQADTYKPFAGLAELTKELKDKS